MALPMTDTWWDTPCDIKMSSPDEPSWIEMHAFKSANAVFNCPLNYNTKQLCQLTINCDIMSQIT